MRGVLAFEQGPVHHQLSHGAAGRPSYPVVPFYIATGGNIDIIRWICSFGSDIPFMAAHPQEEDVRGDPFLLFRSLNLEHEQRERFRFVDWLDADPGEVVRYEDVVAYACHGERVHSTRRRGKCWASSPKNLPTALCTEPASPNQWFGL